MIDPTTETEFQMQPSENPEEVNLELGSIVSIVAPRDTQLNEETFYISYIDNDLIEMHNIHTFEMVQLHLDENGNLTNESIEQILLVSKSAEKGYARQHQLLPKTWVDIRFEADVPVVITGEITNLEEDMIEITTYPDMQTIYIDFAYKGIPKNIPLEEIVIRSKPASLEKISSLVNIREQTQDGDVSEILEQIESKPTASMEYTDSGDMDIQLSEGVTPDKNIDEELQELYLQTGKFIIGEELGEYVQEVELPEHQQRFSLETQVNDLLDELLMKIPVSQRTPTVLAQIHLLIERFKELREQYSRFDAHGNVINNTFLGKNNKPLVKNLSELKNTLKWIVPVVSLRKKVYTEANNDMYNDIVDLNESEVLNEESNIQEQYENNQLKMGSIPQYTNMNQKLHSYSVPMEEPLNIHSYLVPNKEIESSLETIVNNLEDFYSTVVESSGDGGVSYARRQYVIQKYSLGETVLEPTLGKTGRKVYVRKQMTPNDSLTLRSMLTLPLPIWHFSKVQLPLSSILTKVQYGAHFFQMYRLFNRKLEIKNNELDDLKENSEDEFWKETGEFKKHVQHFFKAENDEYEIEGNYNDFLQAVFPNGEVMIRMLERLYSEEECYSFLSVYRGTKALEPFLLYTNELNYSQYNSLRFFMKTHIQKFRKSKEEHNQQLNIYKTHRFNNSEPSLASIFRIFQEKSDFLEIFVKNYLLNNGSSQKHYESLTSSSVVSRMLVQDYGTLFYDLINLMMYSLVVPEKIMEVLEKGEIEDMGAIEKIKASDCERHVLTKKYGSLDALFKDNRKEDVYYDSEYDHTPYKLLDSYKDERKKYNDEDFVDFLEEVLIQKHEIPPKLAKEVALDMIAGKKMVRNGEYAVVEIKPEPKTLRLEENMNEKEKQEIESESAIRRKTAYYKRSNNEWVVDEEVDENVFLDNNDLFCNMNKLCFRNQRTQNCENLSEAQKRLKSLAKQKLLNEFEDRFEISSEHIQEERKIKVEKDIKFLKSMHLYLYIQRHKYSIKEYDIGRLAKEVAVVRSPYIQVRDKILGQGDFVKTQNDILKFVELFCRDPMVEQLGENAYMLYCKDTNTPLLPTFLWELAQAFVSTNTYMEKLSEIVRKQGTLSDDGDSIVDKYSGYVLRKIDNVQEEQYDEAGFKISTTDFLEEDAGNKFVEMMVGKQTTKELVFEDEETQMIFNLYRGIAKNIGIPLDSIQEQVLRMSKEISIMFIASKTDYEYDAKKKEEKTKRRPPPYEVYRNKSIILIVSSVILYSIQTAIPSFKIHKTFPGCVRSFDGFPNKEGSMENTLGLDYICCILMKMKTKSTKPWNSIKPIPLEILKNQMIQIIQQAILTNNNYMEAYTKKAEYLMFHPDETIPSELSLQQWKQFLPPVIPFQVTKGLKEIPSGFFQELVELQIKGHRDQRKHATIYNTKSQQYGLGIIEEINEIVRSKGFLLKTASQIYFTENACCNDRNSSSVLSYFEEENKLILQQNKMVRTWERISKTFKDRAKASFLYDPRKTGLTYGNELPSNHYEINVYAAFIHYCNLDDLRPIPEDLKGLFQEKIPDYPKNAPIMEKIDFLKRHGKRFGASHLQQLMSIINRRNLVQTYLHKDGVNKIQGLNDFLHYLEDRHGTDEEVIFNYSFREKLGAVLKKYNPKVMVYEDNEQVYALNNWLSIANTNLLDRISSFFQAHAKLSPSKWTAYENYLANIHMWNKDDATMNENAMFEVALFMRNSVFSFSKTFPEMIVNKKQPHYNKQKYMNLSSVHNNDILFFINEYYKPLAKFQENKSLGIVLEGVKQELVDLVLFMNLVPLQKPITKENQEGKEMTFYSLFNKRTLYMLYTYTYYSLFYEYIRMTDNDELLQMERLEKRERRRDLIRENNDEFIVGISEEDYADEAQAEFSAERIEIDIRMDDQEELKHNICSLLLAFLDIDMKNKKVMDIHYAENEKKVIRSKLKEKKLITDFLRDLNPDERKVEDTKKKMKMGRWNVGLQKGLVKYDSNRYEEERKQLFEQLTNMVDVNEYQDVPVQRDVQELDEMDETQANEFYDDEAMNFDNYRGTDADGGFYEEDMDNDFMD